MSIRELTKEELTQVSGGTSDYGMAMNFASAMGGGVAGYAAGAAFGIAAAPAALIGGGMGLAIAGTYALMNTRTSATY
jgi:lactobin A/cerein 7B family class IIb bacteriocin